MPLDRTTDHGKPAIAWHAPTPGDRPPAFWKTPPARAALARVRQQQACSRACAVSDQAILDWVMALIRQTWPDVTERTGIAAALAPQVPSWWLGPQDAEHLIANALLTRSTPVRRSELPRRDGGVSAAAPVWAVGRSGVIESHATTAG